MSRSRVMLRRSVGVVLSMALAAVWWASIPTAPARADTAPADTSLPETVSADPLPTVQVDGVVWKQLIVGNTVYVAGEFANARPAGAAPGTNLIPRANMLAYDIRTGALITSFAPSFNAQVKDLAVSPDGTKLYAVGNFTAINGVTRYRAAQFSLPSGTLTSWRPAPNAAVNTVKATNDSVFLGGNFSMMGSTSRSEFAVVNSSNATLLPASATIPDGSIQALVVSPDGSQVVIGGSFTSVDGSSSPGYGLARLDAATGNLLSLPVNNEVRDAGTQAAILDLESDGTNFYGSGYVFGSGGNSEGSFSADWATGSLRWLEDCHGDTYAIYPVGNVVYEASHKHYCGNSGGFPQTSPTWTFHHSTAVTNDVRGTNTHDIYGYPDHPGTPRPEFLDWYPTWTTGTYTGKSQAVWTVTGNSDYVLYGGEFPKVENVAQQGLVRFARKGLAPNAMGPTFKSSKFDLRAVSIANGTVRLSWPGNPDPDNATITYKLYRQSTNDPPIYQTTVSAHFWALPTNTFRDTGLTPGSSQRYRVVAQDPFGNQALSDWVTVTVSSGAAASTYAQDVLNDGATNYWRLDQDSGNVDYDWAGFDDLNLQAGVGDNAAGAINGDSNTASTFSGDSTGVANTTDAITGPNTFSTEAWFRTTTHSGGKIVGFGDAQSGNSSSYDRHIFMDNAGHLIFGVYNNTTSTLQSPQTYNDGQWHQVVSELSSSGMALYVDGKRVARRTDVTNGQAFTGYWRIGGDNLNGWPSQPSSSYFNGTIDEVSLYGTALSTSQVAQHYMDSGRTLTGGTAPADAYGKAVYQADPDLYWRFQGNGNTVTDSSPYGVNAGLSGQYTLGTPGPLAGVSDSSVTFTGSGGDAYSQVQFSNPTTYTLETWFKTTTTSGGKIVGFGSQQTGTSGSYDRHVYMQDNGQLVFGTWTGTTNTITTPRSYNDGGWHYVAATQGPDGMKLYVDGVLTGTNPQTQAQGYNGYWRAGGDTTWGSSSPWLIGSIDEVAVYSHVLSASDVATHYSLGTTGATPNQPPTAAFSSSSAKLKVSVDGSASSDSDGTIASYVWDFGDGGSGSGVTASHTYAAAGTYTVKLTVTDDDGGTDVVSHDVTVTGNQPPTAAFSSSSAKLKVSVDGSASSDSDGTIASYAWDFGDGGSGSGVTASHTYAAAGTYTVKLTVTDDDGGTDVVSHDVTVTGNQPPTAAFSSSSAKLKVSVDGSASSDSDGTIASYAWDFGDGATGTGVTASHTYAAAGTYTVKLTVTDDDGGTDVVSHDVTVTANASPTARFTSSTADLKVSVDGSGSSDSDGTIASYAWDFGDGGSGSGATASHTYGSAGTYSVKLTVTDDDGATDVVSHDVTVSAPADGTIAADAFGRTVSSGWGGADTGGAWTRGTGSASWFSVTGGQGVHTLAAGATAESDLGSVSARDVDVTVSIGLDKLPASGYVYSSIGARIAGSTGYWARARFNADGSVGVHLLRDATALVGSSVVSGLTYAAGDRLMMRFQAEGASPTTLRVKVWKAGSPEPAGWTYTRTDSTAANQAAGAVSLRSYAPNTGNNPVSVTYDDFLAKVLGSTPPPANEPPTARFTSSTADLKVSVDGSGSSDSDGTIASYAWDFGDGGSGSGATASHTYGSAGTYSVKLTVTDDDGATDVVSHDVTVSAPADGTIAADAFGRTVSSGWGGADTGGAWTRGTGSASWFSVTGGQGVHTLAAGATAESDLGSVSARDVDVTVSIGLDKLPASGYVYSSIGARIAGSTGYWARARFNADGSVGVHLLRDATALVGSSVVSGLTYAAGDRLMMRFQAEGASPTTLRVKVWKAGSPEPAGWTYTRTDSTAANQAAGAVSLRSYAPNTGNNPVSVTYDDLAVHEL